MELLVSLPSQCYVKQTFCMSGAAGSHFAKRQRPPSRHELGYLNLDQRIRDKAVSRLLCNSLAHYFEFLNQTSLRGDTSASIRFSDISKRKQINTIKMPKLQFYYAPGACSILPHILLHETGLEFEAIEVTRFDRHSEWLGGYKRINPKMQVPALAIDDEIVTENIAVCTAISNLVPEKHLMGKTPMEIARVYEWLSWLAINLHSGGFAHIFRPYRWSDDEAAHESVKQSALKRIEGIFEAVEERLVGVHAVGGSFTAVEPYLFVFYMWGMEVKFDMKAKFPKYTALVENLVQREAAKAVIRAEGIDGSW